MESPKVQKVSHWLSKNELHLPSWDPSKGFNIPKYFFSYLDLPVWVPNRSATGCLIGTPWKVLIYIYIIFYRNFCLYTVANCYLHQHLKNTHMCIDIYIYSPFNSKLAIRKPARNCAGVGTSRKTDPCARFGCHFLFGCFLNLFKNNRDVVFEKL